MAAESAPPTMRAWLHHRAGAPRDVLSLGTIERATLKSPTDMFVRVHYAALNPGASLLMQLCPMLFRGTPCIPELDFSGEVAAVGEGVPLSRGLVTGTKVFGSIPVSAHLKGKGALAEYVALDAACIVPVPATMPLPQAAGLPVAGAAALKLCEHANLAPGQRVLVNAAAGGIGAFTLQMVRDAIGHQGHLVAVCSEEKAELAKELGANEVVDYRAHAPVHRFLAEEYGQQKFDRVIDAYGVQDLFANCAGFLKEDGLFVTVGIAFDRYTYGSVLAALGCIMKNMLWPRMLGGTLRTYVQISSASTLESLQEMAKRVEAGKLQVPIYSCWEFKDVLNEYEKLRGNHAKGKIVVRVLEGAV